MEPLWTLQQVAQFLQVSTKTVRRLVARRRIPCFRLGRVLRFIPGDVARYVESRKEG